MPKCLLPVYDRPILHYIVSSMVNAGVEDIRIVTWYKESMVRSYITEVLYPEFRTEAEIYNVHQTELNGDGGAVLEALQYPNSINRSFFVVLGDDISCPNPLVSIASIMRTKKALVVEGIIAEPSLDKLKHACSVSILDERIIDIVEKPTTTEDLSWIRGCGVYAFHPDAMDNLPTTDGNYWISRIIKHNIPSGRVFNCIIDTNININTPDDLLEASNFFKERVKHEYSNSSC